MPGQSWMWIAGILVIQTVGGRLPRVWAVRGHILSVVAALVATGFAITGRTWWMVPVMLVLGWGGKLRIRTAGEFWPVRRTAAAVDDAIRGYLDAGRSTLDLEVQPTGALYVLTVPTNEYYLLLDVCPHCFVERYLATLLPAKDGSAAVAGYRESVAEGRTPVATFRLNFGGGWFVCFQRQFPPARPFRPVGCIVHGPKSAVSDT